jgi:hypothetical protein
MTEAEGSHATTGTEVDRAVRTARPATADASDGFERTNGVADGSRPQGQDPLKQRASVATTSAGSKGLRKEVVLQEAVAYASARTVVAGRVSRARRDAVEAVRETCVQIQKTRKQGVGDDS